MTPLQWRHNWRDGVSNHKPHHCLLNRLFWRRSKKTSKLCDTGLCAGNSLVPGEFPEQMASSAERVSIWWCHHAMWSRWSWSVLCKVMACLFAFKSLNEPLLGQCQLDFYKKYHKMYFKMLSTKVGHYVQPSIFWLTHTSAMCSVKIIFFSSVYRCHVALHQ